MGYWINLSTASSCRGAVAWSLPNTGAHTHTDCTCNPPAVGQYLTKGDPPPPCREKDALWQKTEGIDPQAPSPAPRDVGLCARCGKDFRLLSRRYSCRWAWEDTGEYSRDTNHHHHTYRLLSQQAVPGQGVPRVLHGHGEAGAMLPALLPAKAPTGYVSWEDIQPAVPGTWGRRVGPAALVFRVEMSFAWLAHREENNPVLISQWLQCHQSVIAALMP